jgi:hypothetical protein
MAERHLKRAIGKLALAGATWHGAPKSAQTPRFQVVLFYIDFGTASLILEDTMDL